MEAGILNRRIVIQQRQPGQDDAGQPVNNWKKIANGARWANIRMPTGLGTITPLQDNVPASVAKCSIRLRFCEDVKPDMRALYGGRVFEIKAVLPDYAGRQYVDLVCEVGGRDQ